MTPNEPLACWNCRAPLYKQWWNKSKHGYECRRCGAITPAESVPETGSPAAVVFVLIIGLALLYFFVIGPEIWRT